MMLAALLVLIGQSAALPPLLPPDAAACRYDRAAMMTLDEGAFDQDLTGGWRALSNRGCKLAAADLIRDYRAARASPSTLRFLSFWHEGQLRADAGQSSRAITLFESARKSEKEDHGFGWNLYVDGSTAFLRHDRAGLQAARDALAALPKPVGFGTMRGPDGKPMTIDWPLNLNVLDGLLQCFDRGYRVAYTCGKPMFKVEVK